MSTKGQTPTALDVPAGSLPVLSAHELANLWTAQARAIRSNASRCCRWTQRGADKAEAQARQLETCADELRTWVAAMHVRQHEENAADEQRRGKDTNHE